MCENLVLDMMCDMCFKEYKYIPSQNEIEYGIHSGTMTCDDCIGSDPFAVRYPIEVHEDDLPQSVQFCVACDAYVNSEGGAYQHSQETNQYVWLCAKHYYPKPNVAIALDIQQHLSVLLWKLDAEWNKSEGDDLRQAIGVLADSVERAYYKFRDYVGTMQTFTCKGCGAIVNQDVLCAYCEHYSKETVQIATDDEDLPF